MLRLFCFILALSSIAAGQNLATICQKVAEHYRTLDAYRMEGTYQTSGATSAEAGRMADLTAKFLIASGDKGAKRRIEYKTSDFGMILVKNGSVTWTYLPKDKSYTRVEAAPLDQGDADNEATAQNQESSDTVVENLYRFLIQHYYAFDKAASRSELIGEQDVKTADGKVRCWIVATQFPGEVEKSWVDQEHFLVLRSEQTIRSKDLALRVTVSIKSFELERQGDDQFVFEPKSKDKLVDELNVPGMSPVFVGRRALDFQLKDLNGEEVRLSNLRGKIVVLDFWATWCQPCRQELPAINKLANQMKESDVVFLGINDESSGTVKRFNKQNNYTFTTLEDSGGKVHRAYNATSIPNVFVIGKDGVVVKHFIGAREEAELMAGIQAAQSH